MKDYSWLAVFSVFTLAVGFLFTYGNSTNADVNAPPIQVFVTSTTTPSSPIIVETSGIREPAPSVITVNVMIATSSLAAAQPAPIQAEGSTRTYYVTHNTYADNPSTAQEETQESVTLSIQGVYDSATVPLENGETVLELLMRVDKSNSNLRLATQEYGDMGVLVTSMGEYTNGTDAKYWQYQVDGEAPMVGADQYELAGGEVILWEFVAF